MAKERTHGHPPSGLVGLLAYDTATDTWHNVECADDGALTVKVASIPLPADAAKASKQLPDGHAVTVDNPSIPVTGAFYPVTQPVSEATPPARAVQLYGWDGDSWEKLPVAGATGEPLLVRIGSGAVIAQMGDVAGDGISTATKVVFVGGFLYGFNGTTWDRLRTVGTGVLSVGSGSRNLALSQTVYDGVPGDTNEKQLLSVSGPGVLVGLDFVSDHADSYLKLTVDGDSIEQPWGVVPNLLSVATPASLNGVGGESAWLVEGKYDVDNDIYTLFLKREIAYYSTLVVKYSAGLATTTVGVAAQYRGTE